MNKNYLMKKDVVVIFINLMVLSIVVYAYYIVEHLKTILSDDVNLNPPKMSSSISQSKYAKSGHFTDDPNRTNQNVNVRRIRSADTVKCNFIYFMLT